MKYNWIKTYIKFSSKSTHFCVRSMHLKNKIQNNGATECQSDHDRQNGG